MQRKFWLGLLFAGPGVIALAVYGIASFTEEIREDRSGFARFTPTEETARQALEAALRFWQNGHPSGKVDGFDNPKIILVDTCRLPGQTLEQFTILGEAAGEGPRCFAVRVNLSNPTEEQRLRFVVYGIDPLWIYRYEDYEMMTRWECGREERRKAAALQKTGE